MDLRGRHGHGGCLELEGDAVALRELARQIRNSKADVTLSLTDPSPASSAPYLGWLKSLKIVPGSGRVRVSRDEDQVVITGSPSLLAVLAQNVATPAEHDSGAQRPSCHVHIEYHADHYYLASDSVPMVVTLRTARS
jgi:hypothetical protein